MSDRDRTPSDSRTGDSGGTGSDGERTASDTDHERIESNARRRKRRTEPMTDDNEIERPSRGATKDDRSTGESGYRRRVKDIDHASPVDGHNRTFSRANEGRPVKTDGGRRTEPDGTREESADDEARTDEEASTDDDGAAPPADGRVRRRVKDRDHTSPVDGHKRTFMRGDEDADDSK